MFSGCLLLHARLALFQKVQQYSARALVTAGNVKTRIAGLRQRKLGYCSNSNMLTPVF